MKVRVRYFARFREVFGDAVEREITGETTLIQLLREATAANSEGYPLLFGGDGTPHRFVILMLNGKRVEHAEAGGIHLSDGDEIAVFPPVAGG